MDNAREISFLFPVPNLSAFRSSPSTGKIPGRRLLNQAILDGNGGNSKWEAHGTQGPATYWALGFHTYSSY